MRYQPELPLVGLSGPTFDEENQRDVQKRPKGAVQKPGKNIISDPKETLGISDKFGFTSVLPLPTELRRCFADVSLHVCVCVRDCLFNWLFS